MQKLINHLVTVACAALIAIVASGCSDAGFTGAKASASGSKKGKAEAADGPAVPAPLANADAVPEPAPVAEEAAPGDVGSTETERDKDKGVLDSGETSITKDAPQVDPLSTDDGLVKAKPSYTIPKLLTAFYKKAHGTTNFYGKVEGNGPSAGNFYQVECPSGSFSASGTAVLHFMVLVGTTWTKYSLGDKVPLDPAQPIYAKIEFDTHSASAGDDHHFTKDANVDIRSYFGPHPQYPDVSIAINTTGSAGSWQVGIGRGKDATRHPPTPDNSYMTPPPACD